ncbi:MAG: CHAT domain-containing protein, partial [Bacteroidetes bacterium]|nr:CHAT domain-containing protein [Bacteroidota bacterium]
MPSLLRRLRNEEVAKTIFELLIPNDFKMAIRNQQNILVIVDKATAGYPWEMLQDISTQQSPISTTIGMIRQLATEDFSTSVNYTRANRALIIGDPVTQGFLPALGGAEEEAKHVSKLLLDNGFETISSIKQPSSSIIKSIFKSEYKVIHLAGHGFLDKDNPENSGMVIGNGIFLTAKEIQQLTYIPEMVFINCCHLGKSDLNAENTTNQKYKFAANLGTQLIRMGVKVVVAAGWAINDTAALEFTKDFYNYMLEGQCFGDAIRNARKNCFFRFPETNTWGAYQCYGDQFYTLNKTAQVKRDVPKKYYIAEQAKLDLENLMNSIEANYSDDGRNYYKSEL